MHREAEGLLAYNEKHAPAIGGERAAFPDTLKGNMREETRSTAQTLLIDADDTLWENNIYFERAIAGFISYLNHHEYGPGVVRETLNEIEREHISQFGYGVACFSRSLVACFERLSPEPMTAEKYGRVASFAQAVAGHEIELIPGVAETLPELARRHRLILMTKGNEAEQAEKVLRSGLRGCFRAVEVVAEKNREAYDAVCEKHGVARSGTWMIGNSPKSDIKPALAAGLHAVYIRHPSTWALEHEALEAAPAGQRLVEVESFANLREFF
jgi:putative hydrolase of the HAD superfamily